MPEQATATPPEEQLEPGVELVSFSKPPKKGEEGERLEGSVYYNFGVDLQAAVELFGADQVFSGFVSDCRVGLQGVLRKALEAGLDEDKLQEIADEYKPGTRATRFSKDPKKQWMDAWAKMSAEDRKAMLEKVSQS